MSAIYAPSREPPDPISTVQSRLSQSRRPRSRRRDQHPKKCARKNFRAHWFACGYSALRELEASAGFGVPVFLALDHARISGKKTVRLERGAQSRLVGNENAADAMAHSAGLTGKPATHD